MGDVETAALSADEDYFREADRRAYFEQRLFVLSPVGPFVTALFLFIVIMGLFAIVAKIDHIELIHETANGIAVEDALRMAFILTAMLCVSLFIQRYTRLKDRADAAAFRAALKPGAIERRNLVQLTPANARLMPPTIVGILLGLGLSWPLFAADMLHREHPPYATLIWFVIVNVLLMTAFARGVELSRTGSRVSADAIEHDLVVDLLRIDLLAVWGRSSARFALIWFTVSAVACLFFVGNGISAFTVSVIAVLLALGIYVFVRPMERVHRKIRAAKASELERIRHQIDELRDAATVNADAAIRLQGLLAYETRIAAAPEWPFDQTTLVRVAASALILTVPWFGQAIAAYVVEHMSRITN